VTKNVDVAEVFNNFFVNVAQDIGKDYTFNKKACKKLKINIL
jgi:hypothetical protein